MNNWQLASTIFLVLGIAALVIGLLLRFKAGRWVLGLLLVVFFIASLFDDHPDLTGPDADTRPEKASRFLLIAGGICLALTLLISYSHPSVS
ncbi:hypothetical protein ACFQ48_00975 [Hymenobacter caeli]|uniref:Membrane protein YphA (DoxX/SURF4 family) n=1 Tax=Hymenobacter caeli TaxID=2735894 RepID=A0ABX2FLI6_9BACT|nr:hypothetical protein [Hymenobacter caeli]NRT17394.1 putative membrane protein YphA (DoxX/SURF4 family) [Hymenobacter caeli]